MSVFGKSAEHFPEQSLNGEDRFMIPELIPQYKNRLPNILQNLPLEHLIGRANDQDYEHRLLSPDRPVPAILAFEGGTDKQLGIFEPHITHSIETYQNEIQRDAGTLMQQDGFGEQAAIDTAIEPYTTHALGRLRIKHEPILQEKIAEELLRRAISMAKSSKMSDAEYEIALKLLKAYEGDDPHLPLRIASGLHKHYYALARKDSRRLSGERWRAAQAFGALGSIDERPLHDKFGTDVMWTTTVPMAKESLVEGYHEQLRKSRLGKDPQKLADLAEPLYEANGMEYYDATRTETPTKLKHEFDHARGLVTDTVGGAKTALTEVEFNPTNIIRGFGVAAVTGVTMVGPMASTHAGADTLRPTDRLANIRMQIADITAGLAATDSPGVQAIQSEAAAVLPSGDVIEGIDFGDVSSLPAVAMATPAIEAAVLSEKPKISSTAVATPAKHKETHNSLHFAYGAPEKKAVQAMIDSAQARGDNQAVREAQALGILMAEGLTPMEAVGFLGNFAIESWVNPNQHQIGGGPGRGIAQWTVDQRWQDLLVYAAKHGWQPRTMKAQIKFALYEAANVPPYDKTLRHLHDATTINEAVIMVEKYFEKAGHPALGKRADAAHRIYDTFYNYMPGDHHASAKTRATAPHVRTTAGPSNINISMSDIFSSLGIGSGTYGSISSADVPTQSTPDQSSTPINVANVIVPMPIVETDPNAASYAQTSPDPAAMAIAMNGQDQGGVSPDDLSAINLTLTPDNETAPVDSNSGDQGQPNHKPDKQTVKAIEAAAPPVSSLAPGASIVQQEIRRYGGVSGKLSSGELERLGSQWGGARAETHVADSFRDLNAAFKAQFGRDIKIAGTYDAYRPFSVQQDLKVTKPTLAATPGKSEHGWGFAIDFSSHIGNPHSAENKWMHVHAPRFGFKHPDWAEPGGSKPEPWHWEWVGSSDHLPGSS